MHDWHVSINKGESGSRIDLHNYPVCIKLNGGSVRFDLRPDAAEALAVFLTNRIPMQNPRSEMPFGSYQGRHYASWTEAGSAFIQSSAEGAVGALLSEDSAKRLAEVIGLRLPLLEPVKVMSQGGDTLAGAKKKTDDNLRRVFG